MPSALLCLIATVVTAAFSALAHGGFHRTASLFALERAFPVNQMVEIEALNARDSARHSRLLQGVGGVVDFSVSGTSDPYLVGLYFTRVKLGTPPREYNVQIDTGSDVLWITCNSCSDCPRTSGLGIDLSFYDATGSSTAALVSCSDPVCASVSQTTSAMCSTQTDQCSYSFQYGDGSGTSGFYVSDMFYFDMILGDAMIANSSASILFGCSSYQSGDLTKSDRAIDGIFGFGQQSLSVISQLSSRGITPKVFSHCLKGDNNGGGILVLGEILDPSIVFSPLVPSQPHYNLNLQSIAVNGQLLPIDPEVFATSSNQGTIIDSGTTLAYLVEEAYDPFVRVITDMVLQTVKPVVSKGNQCYLFTMSVNDIFPGVSLNFAGGASLVLKPEEYLVHMGFVGGAPMWCMGFQKVQGRGVTILGDSRLSAGSCSGSAKTILVSPIDGMIQILFTYQTYLVLKDKVFVYDLARQRIGWANYNCSSSVNVSITFSRDEYVNAGQLSVSSSLPSFGLISVVGVLEALVMAQFFLHFFLSSVA